MTDIWQQILTMCVSESQVTSGSGSHSAEQTKVHKKD